MYVVDAYPLSLLREEMVRLEIEVRYEILRCGAV